VRQFAELTDNHISVNLKQKMKKTVIVFLGVSVLSFCIQAEAFDIKGLQPVPPFGVFSTFSAESLKQNEIAVSVEMERSDGPDFNRASLKGAYGVHNAFEVMFTMPYVFANKQKNDGMEDVSFGVRHRLLDESKYLPAFAYILTVSTATQNDELSSGGAIGGGMVFTKKIGPFKGHLNLLYISPQKQGLERQYELNIGTEFALTNNTTLLAELAGKKDFTDDRLNRLEWRAGFRFANSENVYTTFGAGIETKNRHPDLRLLFSISFKHSLLKGEAQKVVGE
jgi:hypothetical protein